MNKVGAVLKSFECSWDSGGLDDADAGGDCSKSDSLQGKGLHFCATLELVGPEKGWRMGSNS